MRNAMVQAGGKLLACFVIVLFCVTAMNAQGDAEKTYKAKCAACHGPDGSGSTPAGKAMGVHDFKSGDVQKESDAQLNEVIAKGKNKMPSYEKSLKPDEIAGLVTYVRSLAGKK